MTGTAMRTLAPFSCEVIRTHIFHQLQGVSVPRFAPPRTITPNCIRLFRHLLCSAALLAAAVPAHAQVTLERLSLFAEQGGNTAAHTAEGAAASGAPDFSALGVQASASHSAADGQRQWVWTLKNTSGKNLAGARISAFLDADIQAAENTFFNEAVTPDAGVGTQPSTATQFYPDKWEAGEPGYWTDDLLARSAAGDLKNQVLDAAEDAALALSLPVGDWPAGRTLTVTATLAEDADAGAVLGLVQSDTGTEKKLHFSLFAKVDSVCASGQTQLGDGSCCPTADVKGEVCCPDPGKLDGAGACCASGNVVDGVCDPVPAPTPPTPQIPASDPVAVPALGASGLLLLALGLPAAAWRARRWQLLPAILIALLVWLPADDAHATFTNGGFETGDLTGWEHDFGRNPDTTGLQGEQPYDHTSIVINPGGEEIVGVVGHEFDPRAPQLELPRWGEYALRLNDYGNNYHINHATQTVTITEDDRDISDGKLHVRFSYAAVLEDPEHPAHQQPYFHVLLEDVTTGDILYEDFAYSGQPGRVFYTTRWGGSPWHSTPFIDVDMPVPDSSLGHEVRVRVLAADCALGGHGGYVYVDSFGSQRIPPQKMCLNIDLAARAKPGKVQLTWVDSGAASYAIYRASDLQDGSWRRVAETTSRWSTWLDTDVQTGQTYFYSVRPLDADGKEQCTSVAVAAVPPPEWAPGQALQHPPRITSQPQTTGKIGEAWNYSIQATDQDGTALTYELAQAPQGMTLNKNQLAWEPKANGNHHLTIVVRNGHGLVASQSVVIDVSDGQRPVIGALPPVNVPAGLPFNHNLEASSPDGKRLVYSISSQAVGMSIDEYGNITWSDPQTGTYPYTIVVADERGLRTEYQGTFIVPVPVPPQFTSTPPAQGRVGQEYTYPAQATDPKGGSITYRLLKNPNYGSSSVDKDSGLVTWKPTRIGTYTFELEAISMSTGGRARQDWTVEVTPGLKSPVITSTPPATVNVGETYTYYPSASDPDGDQLSYTLVKAPDGASLGGWYSTYVSWAPTQSGVYDFALTVTDGERTDTQSWSVTVNGVPTITSEPATSAKVGTTYVYELAATDPEGDPLTYELNDYYNAGAVLNGNRLEWTPTPGQANDYFRFIVTVSDGKGSTRQDWRVDVVPGSEPPTITSEPATSVKVGTTYVYEIAATDPEGNPLTYELNDRDRAGAVLNGNRLEWTPTLEQVNDWFRFTVTVSDGTGASTKQDWRVDVVPGSEPPVITSEPPATATVGVPYVYELAVTDPEGDPLTYELNDRYNAGAVLNGNRLEWTPTPGQANDWFRFIVTVSDGTGASAKQDWRVDVAPAP